MFYEVCPGQSQLRCRHRVVLDSKGVHGSLPNLIGRHRLASEVGRADAAVGDVAPGQRTVLDIGPGQRAVTDVIPGQGLVLDVVPGERAVLDVFPGEGLVLDLFPDDAVLAFKIRRSLGKGLRDGPMANSRVVMARAAMRLM